MNIDNPAYTSRNAEKFVVRLPKGMRERIAQVAKRYRRSMNSEIVCRLEASLRQEAELRFEIKSSPQQLTYDDAVDQEYDDLPLTSELPKDIEEHLLFLFRQLSIEQQKALVSLLTSAD